MVPCTFFVFHLSFLMRVGGWVGWCVLLCCGEWWVVWVVLIIHSTQMDEKNLLEEIRNWEHPPWYGIDQFKERVTLTFLENQKDLFHNLKTRFRMPVKLWTIFGPCREASFTAITLNPELNFTRGEKNHSLFHWDTLTSPELTQIWMLSKSVASMIFECRWIKRLVGSLDRFHTIYSIGRKKLLTDICGPGGDWRENSLHPGQIIYQWESTPSWRRSKSGLRKRSILRTQENCEGSISSTPRIRNSKKPSRTRVRSWKHQWLLLCLAKLLGTIRIVGVVHPTKLKQNLRVFWKLMNPPECVWETLNLQITKTILQEKVRIHCSITIWFTSLFLCLKLWKFRAAKAGVDKEWEKLEKISALNLTKVKSKKQVIDEARTSGATVHFASLMSYVIWKMLNWRQSTRNTKVELFSAVIL